VRFVLCALCFVLVEVGAGRSFVVPISSHLPRRVGVSLTSVADLSPSLSRYIYICRYSHNNTTKGPGNPLDSTLVDLAAGLRADILVVGGPSFAAECGILNRLVAVSTQVVAPLSE
jgi:hypothetical protein